MDIEKYLASLEDDEQLNIFSKEEDGLEPGLLSELEMQSPEELHSLIMKVIKNETAATIPQETTKFIKKNNKYKRYMPIVAAAAIFVVFVGNMNFNKNNKVAFKSVTQEQKVVVNINDKANKKSNIKTEVPSKTNKTNEILNKGNKILTASASSNKINRQDQIMELKVNHIEGSPVAKKGTNVENNTGDGDIIVSVNDAVNGNTLQKRHSDSDNVDSKNIVVASNDYEDEGMQDNSEVLRYFAQPNLNYDYDDNVLLAMNSAYNEDADYEVNLYMNQTEAINYIYNSGNMIGANVYQFNSQDFYSLRELLASKNIDIRGLHDSKEKGEYVTVNVAIN